MSGQDEHPQPSPEAVARMAAFEAACDALRPRLEAEARASGYVRPAVYPGGSPTPPVVAPEPAPEPEPAPLQVVPLPGGHVWHVSPVADPARYARWQELLRTEGASLAMWHELLAAYDAGWSLPAASPAAMPDVTGWSPVPLEAADALVAWVAAQAAGVLAAA